MFGFDADMVFRIPALLLALTIHEYAHARVAVYLGDPTPRYEGRLTLNPVAHLDPIGLIMLWLFKFGWAKPVPIDPRYFKNGRQGMLMVSFAGPVSNLLLAFASALLMGILIKLNFLSGGLLQVLRYTYIYNLIFAVFNLIPIPPLDGSKILMSLLPGRQAYALERIEPYGSFILIALVYLNIINSITSPIINLISLIMQHIINIIL